MKSHQHRPGLGKSLILGSTVLLVILSLAGLASAYPPCSQLSPPTGVLYSYVGISFSLFSWNGVGFGSGCAVNSLHPGNILGCSAGPSSLGAYFFTPNLGPAYYCNFDCGPRGQCTIRGGDGLPVELMSVSVE